MRGKVDENMPTEAVGILEGAGWSCDTVLAERLGGTEDHASRESARRNSSSRRRPA
jgi:hypothetical protein